MPDPSPTTTLRSTPAKPARGMPLIERPVRLETVSLGALSDDLEHWLSLTLPLLSQPTASFKEQRITEHLVQFAESRGLAYEIDSAGNLLIHYQPSTTNHNRNHTNHEGKQPLIFSAHMDHPGFWALGSADQGQLLAQWIGRVPEAYFPGADVVFHADTPVTGRVLRVVDRKPDGEVNTVLIETQTQVPRGTVGTWSLPDPDVSNGRLQARAIDDVLGCAALVCLLDRLVQTRSSAGISCLFTRAEEAGFIGCTAFCKARLSNPELQTEPLPMVIGIEMSMTLTDAPLGHGPIVRVGDRRSVFDRSLTDACVTAAQRLTNQVPGFRFQRKLMDGGTCESSVFDHYFGQAGALCLAMGNYHNVDATNQRLAREYVDLNDYAQLIHLLIAIAETPPSHSGNGTNFEADCEQLLKRYEHLLPASEPMKYTPQ